MHSYLKSKIAKAPPYVRAIDYIVFEEKREIKMQLDNANYDLFIFSGPEHFR